MPATRDEWIDSLLSDARYSELAAELQRWKQDALNALLAMPPTSSAAELQRQIGQIAGLDVALRMPELVKRRIRAESDADERSQDDLGY